MGCTRNDRVVVRGAALLAVALLLGAPLLSSCGGSSSTGADNATGGAAGSASGGVGTAAGGAHSAGGTASGGVTHSGGTPSGGTPSGGAAPGGMPSGGSHTSAGDVGAGGASQAGGEGPAGGAVGHDEGWPCGTERCSFGQTCIRCSIESQTKPRCVPNPDQDPTGYASATAACEAPPYSREDCNGPEDCAAGQYCVAREGTRCLAEPSTKHLCCFACNAPTDCTLCHADQDCPNGEVCVPNQSADSKGCRLVK